MNFKHGHFFELHKTITARFLAINILEYEVAACMKIEFYTCGAPSLKGKIATLEYYNKLVTEHYASYRKNVENYRATGY